MTTTAKVLLFIGALNAALVVIAGAYGAHGLKQHDQAALFQTAVQYHMFHALGLLVIGALAVLRPDAALLAWAGGLMLLGVVLFCGSLYLQALAGYRLGGVAPFGGTAFILAWALLAIAVLRS